ncbi:efflux RND transporter periplasmic adaptor subunit [Anaerocolumna xylanovorans]|uniref:HlyD family secretion protein n=1 Tax=Anaerocolumna xylanovorans DSM 12503 TaxID=1121345 RepID=A0A1M7YLU2_9FIRM|nr:efflux RND transporter periplasmic adaptor subunit [Anaerocolumna xylanovorans]SHO53605.1 HlyD family secretion protein [Anaerocolumna xylanovorans DSM 12503]
MNLFKKKGSTFAETAKAGTAKTETANGKKPRKKSKSKKIIRIVIIVLIIVIAAGMGYKKLVLNKAKKAASENTVTTAKVETRDIENTLTSSGTVQPLNTYEVKTLVEGEVISADFEEGDEVEKGQVLYQVTTDTLDKKIDQANTSVSRAEKNYDKSVENYDKAKANYEDALKDYNEAADKYKNLNLTAASAGVITELMVKEGDNVQKGSQLAKIYDNSYMLLDVYFNASDVTSALVGKTASVQLSGGAETLSGTVTKVSSLEEALSGNRIVKKVTIKVKNPGGITAESKATASIGTLSSSEEGSFQPLTDTVITAEKAGEVAKLSVEEGDKVAEGDSIAVLDKDSIEDQLDSYNKTAENAKDSMENAKDSIETAKESIEDAKSALDEVVDTKTDYSITAPISGKVIRKDALEGDTINSQSSLCVIYDLSAVTFEMYVDELDVKSVAVGQEVNVTADALENAKISGVVTNISLESTTNGGVTQYPVTVRINDAGDLLPGMNVTGEIIVEKAEGVLAIPADALMRGDVVYVKDASVTKANGSVPAGFKEVEIETGLTDGNYIEVKSGLSEGDEVYVKRTSSGTTQTMMPGGFNMEGGQGGPGGNWQGGSSQRSGSFGGGQSRSQGSGSSGGR